MIKRIEDILKIIFLSLISILIIVVIIQKTTTNDNTNKYLSWCRDDYLGNSYPSQGWIKDCVKKYQKIEKDLKK